jgi:hypothetical protein
MPFDNLDQTARADRAVALWQSAILALLLISVLGLALATFAGHRLPLDDQAPLTVTALDDAVG